MKKKVLYLGVFTLLFSLGYVFLSLYSNKNDERKKRDELNSFIGGEYKRHKHLKSCVGECQ